MRKVLAVALLGFAALGLGASQASAWPLETLFQNHRCCAKICCKQYNAFSPFCCEGAAGSSAMPGNGYGDSPACSFAGDQDYLGELSVPGANGAAVPSAPVAPPANGGATSGSSTMAPGRSIQPPLPGGAPQPLPAWGSGLANPPGVPGYYPGFTGYGPGNGNGFPSYPPGFTGYGPGNGNNAPSYYPGAMGYGPANGFGR